MTTTYSIGALEELVGHELGVSSFHEVTQGAIDAFADVTGDHQWIHTDPERAATGPFGGTIAHGYYTLSIAPALLEEVLDVSGFDMAVNYGLDKLRFPAPLPVGDSVRLRAVVAGVERFEGGATLRLDLTLERPEGGKPVCAAQALYRVFSDR